MRFPQNGLTCSPVRKTCRSANSFNNSFDANNDIDGTYCTYRQSTLLSHKFNEKAERGGKGESEGERGKGGTSTITPRYRFACLTLAHQILQSFPHSNPLPSSTNAVPCRSCHPVSIRAKISVNEAPNSMTVNCCGSS